MGLKLQKFMCLIAGDGKYLNQMITTTIGKESMRARHLRSIRRHISRYAPADVPCWRTHSRRHIVELFISMTLIHGRTNSRKLEIWNLVFMFCTIQWEYTYHTLPLYLTALLPIWRHPIRKRVPSLPNFYFQISSFKPWTVIHGPAPNHALCCRFRISM